MYFLCTKACTPLCFCTLTGPAVRVEDEAGVTGAGIRAGDVGTQLLAVTIAAFINICLKKKKKKERDKLVMNHDVHIVSVCFC